MKTHEGRILILEEDSSLARRTRQHLEESGHAVLVAATAQEGLETLGQHPIDLVLLDQGRSGGQEGLHFYSRMRQAGFDLPVILTNGPTSAAAVLRSGQPAPTATVNGLGQCLDCLSGVVEGVLRQTRAELQLAESEARLAAIIHSAKDAILITEADRRITLFNPAAEAMFGCPASEAIGQKVTRFIPRQFHALQEDQTEDPERPGETLTHLIRTGNRGIRVDGTEFPLEATVSRAVVAGRKVYSIVVRDISQRQRAEAAQRRADLQFRLVWERSLDGMRLTDGQGVIRQVNEAFCRLVKKSRTELEGQPFTVTEAVETRAQALEEFRQRFATHDLEPFTTQEVILWDGSRLQLEATNSFLDLPGEPPLLLSILRDVTAQKRLEEQLHQVLKMEGIGRLAAGVAHDFNNLLTVILGYSEVLLRGLAVEAPQYALVQEVLKAGERAEALTRQLLAFSHKQLPTPPQVIDLNALVRELQKMLGRLIGEDIDLAVVLEPSLGRVKVDPGQMEQVIINLAVNARDAMPAGGYLTLETRNLDWDEAHAQVNPALRPGRYVMLAVTDSGCGMDEATRARIFEPFFTTKEIGKGTGLGLATVYGILQQSNGHIDVYSEPGQGTSFKIYLPRLDSVFAEQSVQATVTAARGTETILLTEDEQGVRSLAALTLRSYGYTVLEADSGPAALEICRAHPGPIHLLLTDVVMPRMSGRQLADHVAQLRPGTRTLYISGYTDETILRHGLVRPNSAYLSKPFTPTVLARKVREVLDQV